jgi:hypothetical protein
MTISFTNKLRILCYKYGIFEKGPFVAAWKEVQPKAEDANIESSRDHYFDGAAPKKNRVVLVKMLQSRAEKQAIEDAKLPPDERPPDLRPIEALLNKRMTTPEFIELCRVRFPDLQTHGILNKDAAMDWKKRYNGMHFMERLIEFEEDRDGRKLLKAMLGTYHLYRRHSVLPGILREVVVVEERRYGHAEGTYYQYKRGEEGGWNEIKFNVFFAGFYVLAFGAFKTEEQQSSPEDAAPAVSDKAKKKGSADPKGAELRPRTRTEILEIKILIENALLKGRVVNCEQPLFPGILTGIYDYGNILLAERILVRRICDATKLSPGMIPKRLVSDKAENAPEYYAVLDAIDNASNGQTLSIRPIHLEKPYLRDELLPDPKTFITSMEEQPPPNAGEPPLEPPTR